MDLSGIIFVVLAIAWAVYLVPKALRHHEEMARTRSVDRFSTAMRVLARREPVDKRSTRLVVTPARYNERILLPSQSDRDEAPAPAIDPAARRRSIAARRAAARAAARRRRHVTLVLLITDLVVGVLAAFSVLAWWSVLIPVALTLLYLALCRTQVRREEDALWSPAVVAARVEESAPRRAVRVEASYGAVQAPVARETAAAAEEFSPDEDTITIPLSELETVAVAVETVDGGSLWDPLPVTLPTYVNKARAARTVRTIDLGAPDTWTSGRDEADSALVEQATADAAEEVAETEQQRAVNS
ncbi:divisome protein SepX/GlpR [Nocardioides pakistanensis]